MTASALAANDAATLCRNDERTVFACQNGNDTIAICSSKNLAPQAGYVHLRVGTPTRLEINGPGAAEVGKNTKPANTGTKGITKGSLLYGGSFGRYVRFRTKGTSYVVFSVPGKGDKSGTHGMVTEKGAAIVQKRLCQSVQTSELGSLPVPAADAYAVSGLR